MRLGLLGPANGDVAALGRAVEFLLNRARVDRAIYLGRDRALDHVVAAWATKLVGDDPSDEGAWRRAAELAPNGSAAEIDRFVARERARSRLKVLEALPEESARTIATIGGFVAVPIDDERALEEEDILAANLLFFGQSASPVVRRVESRWFVSPGALAGERGGVAVVEDDRGAVTVSIHDKDGVLTHQEVFAYLDDELAAPEDDA